MTDDGAVTVIDFMTPLSETSGVVRLVGGVRGRVRVQMDLSLRFGCGRIRPMLRRLDGADVVTAGVESVWLRTPVETRAEDAAVCADFFVSSGELLTFVLTWHASNEPAPVPVDPFRALADTESFWNERARAALSV